MSLRELVPQAIIENDLETLISLLSADVDLNAQIGGATPLCHAAIQGQVEVGEFLIKSGVDINVTSNLVFDSWRHANWKHMDNINGGQLPPPSEQLGSVTPFNAAAIYGNLEFVKLLYSHNAEIDTADSFNKNALNNACTFGHEDVTLFLLPLFSDVNSRDISQRTTSIKAAIAGNLTIIKCLVEHQADINLFDRFHRTPLHYAVLKNETEIVTYLLQSKADLVADDDAMTPLALAVKKGNVEIIESLLSWREKQQLFWRSEEGHTLLHLAAKYGHREVLVKLVNLQLDVNRMTDTCMTPLCTAVKHNRSDIVEQLISVGCDVNIPQVPRVCPLDLAIVQGSAHLTRLLIKGGADMDRINLLERTPLMEAISNNKPEIAKLLLDSGCDVTIHDFHGNTVVHLAIQRHMNTVASRLVDMGLVNVRTSRSNIQPLHVASIWGNLEMTLKLIQSGGDVNSADRSGMTPLDHSLMVGRCRPTGERLVSLLLLAGADINRTRLARSNREQMIDIIRSSYSEVYPMKLVEMSRICIRHCLQSDLFTKIEMLPLPQQLKDYTLFNIVQ